MSTTVYTATEQFADFSKANVAQAQKIAALALENAEKFLKLNLNAAKVVLANGAEGASAVAAVKDIQDLMVLRAKYAETGVQTATAYTKSLYELSSEAQAQFTALAEEAWSAYTKDAAAWVETCGEYGQRFAITGGAGPESKFEDIRCPSCHAFWGRSPSHHGFQTTALTTALDDSR